MMGSVKTPPPLMQMWKEPNTIITSFLLTFNVTFFAFRCWSSIGKVGGVQTLSLMSGGCMARGVVQHEIEHALGFYHEQSRSDRDEHLDVIWQNINEGMSCLDHLLDLMWNSWPFYLYSCRRAYHLRCLPRNAAAGKEQLIPVNGFQAHNISSGVIA